MAGIKRLQAVPVVFVWIALCFPGPSAAIGATSIQARDAAFVVVLAAPCGPQAQLVGAKADKPLVFSSACLATPAASHTFALIELVLAVDACTTPPGVHLSCPPLSPRPPPAA